MYTGARASPREPAGRPGMMILIFKTTAISAPVSWATGLLSLPLTIDVAHNRPTREWRGWAAYVLSTVWFAVGDYCRLLLRFARLLPDHLRDCHATEPP